MEPVLSVENLVKNYESKENVVKAVDRIYFQVFPEEYIGIMGPSGSGKTTLLNCIATIDGATSGHIIINGKDITAMDEEELSAFRREELGFIFQDFNLLDTLSARDNIALALAILNREPGKIEGKIEEVASELGVREILDKYPYEISGGQKQRVACARAIVTQPSLILADEPTGALDSKAAGMLLENLRMLNERRKATILMVTHDAFTASHCKRILFIKDGKIFRELKRQSPDRKEFFDQIMSVVTELLGEESHVVA